MNRKNTKTNEISNTIKVTSKNSDKCKKNNDKNYQKDEQFYGRGDPIFTNNLSVIRSYTIKYPSNTVKKENKSQNTDPIGDNKLKNTSNTVEKCKTNINLSSKNAKESITISKFKKKREEPANGTNLVIRKSINVNPTNENFDNNNSFDKLKGQNNENFTSKMTTEVADSETIKYNAIISLNGATNEFSRQANDNLICNDSIEESVTEAIANLACKRAMDEAKPKSNEIAKRLKEVPKQSFKKVSNIDERRRKIREKYTLKLKPVNKINVKIDEEIQFKTSNSINVERKKQHNLEKTQKDALNSSPAKIFDSNTKHLDIKIMEDSQRRKPMIKTIISRAENMRIFKAVTFTENKSEISTPLDIKIPTNIIKPAKQSKFTDTNSLKSKTIVSRVNITDNRFKRMRNELRKNIKKNRQMPSSDENIKKGNISPPTEIAKWGPGCFDKFTKPYYEAWVDTTLAAISKDDNFDVQSYLRSLQKALNERPVTPEFVYENLKDERHTGRIKITHKYN